MSTDSHLHELVELQEQVRARYAEAARSVTAGGANPLAMVTSGCCTPTQAATEHTDQHTDQQAGGEAGCGESCCTAGGSGVVDEAFGAGLYGTQEQGEVPAEALAASLGCGNPTAVAALHEGERVLDLGSGGGIEALHNRGCSWGLNPPLSRSDRAM